MLYAEVGAISSLVDYSWTRPAQWRRTTNDLADPDADVAVYCQAVTDCPFVVGPALGESPRCR